MDATNKNITDMSERELVAIILRIYTSDEVAIRNIAYHISEKLTCRRTILRERRKKAA